MKSFLFFIALTACAAVPSLGQDVNAQPKKWGLEVNVLWPIFPGNIYKFQATREVWRTGNLAGDVYAGVHIRPFEFREDEGDFANYALTFGYRQFVWKGLHAEVYQAFGPGFNRNNAIDGNDYISWDYEMGLLAGYRFELFSQEKRAQTKLSPYISTQHGVLYLAAQSNPHPIVNSTGERPFYAGTLNLGILF